MRKSTQIKPNSSGMRSSGIDRAQEAGFSLVELLVSLAILSIVAGLLASGLNLGQTVWWRSEEKAHVSRARFDAETALRRLLDNLQPLHSNTQDSSAQGLNAQGLNFQDSGSQNARAIDFRGSPDELEGIVPLPPYIGLGGLYRFRLFRDKSARRLDLTFHAYDEPRSADAGGRDDNETGLTTLASEIDGLELRYFGKAKGEDTPNWRSDWQGQGELPTLISIKVKGLKTGGAWPELLIAPRVKPVDWR